MQVMWLKLISLLTDFFVSVFLCYTMRYVDPEQVNQALKIHQAKEIDLDDSMVSDDVEVKDTETAKEGIWVL